MGIKYLNYDKFISNNGFNKLTKKIYDRIKIARLATKSCFGTVLQCASKKKKIMFLMMMVFRIS